VSDQRQSGGIVLRRIDHVCLRVDDLAEAAPRWAIQFGLTEKRRAGDHAYLACGYEPYSLELAAGDRPGHDHTGFELARGVTLDAAARRLDALGVRYREEAGALHLADPDGNGIELMPYRRDDDPFPPVARRTEALPGFRPRKLGHVNFLTADVATAGEFYTDVLGMRVTDRLGDEGAWYHVNADHHVMALVGKGYAHFHHLALEMTDWGELRVAFDHLAQHGRWLGWGPVRHGLGRNLCGYVRIPDEHCFVEVFCDMEQLEPDHEPRDWPDTPHSSNTWGVLPPRSYFRFDDEAIESERLGLEALGQPLS
jgi:catechol-2,3-dioxygenase